MTTYKQERTCIRKRIYFSEEEAQSTITTIKRRAKKRKRKPPSLFFYICPFCRCYHLTSQEQ